MLQGYKDWAAVGMRSNLSDRLQLNRLSLSASCSPDTDLPARNACICGRNIERFDWRAEAVVNEADFYDLFGPTKRAQGLRHGMGRKSTCSTTSRGTWNSTSRALSRVISTGCPIPRTARGRERPGTVDATLRFSDVRNSLGTVDEETGVKSAAVSES